MKKECLTKKLRTMKKLFTKKIGTTKVKNAKRILTFRTFLVILAGGIMVTACIKEETKPKDILKILDRGVLLNGNSGDLYENVLTSQKVFFIENFSKASDGKPKPEDLKYDYKYNGAFFRCDDPGDECLYDYM